MRKTLFVIVLSLATAAIVHAGSGAGTPPEPVRAVPPGVNIVQPVARPPRSTTHLVLAAQHIAAAKEDLQHVNIAADLTGHLLTASNQTRRADDELSKSISGGP